MKEMKRILSLFLCLVMLVGYLPVGALAAEGESATEPTVVETTEATEAAVETTEAATEETTEPVVETTEAIVETTEATVPETTEETVPETKPVLPPMFTFMGGISKEAAGDTQVTAIEQPLDVAVIFTDLHAHDYHNNDYKKDHMQAILSAMKSLPITTVTSGGDVFSVNKDSDKDGFAPFDGQTKVVTKNIQEILGDVEVNYVWSDHDRYALDANGSALDKSSRLVYTGNYYIYLLSMADLGTNDRYRAGFYTDEEVTAHIKAFADEAESLDKTKPLFIVGHMPLYYKAQRADNGHAYEWITAINKVAETMDVAYFFGHNHKYDSKDDYYKAVGDTISVMKLDKSTTNVQLNFAHVHAGYMEPKTSSSYSDTTTRMNVAVAAMVYEDELRFVAYDEDGVYDGSLAPLNKSMSRSHKDPVEVTPTTKTVSASCTADGVDNLDTVTAAGLGLTGVTASWNDGVDISEFDARDTVVYDVALAGYTAGDAVELSFYIDSMTAEDLVVYSVSNGEKASANFTAQNVSGEEGSGVNVILTQSAAAGTYIIGKLGVSEDAVLTGIAVTKQPTVSSYTVLDGINGDLYINIAGLEVTATYSDGETAVIDWNQFQEEKDGYTLSGNLRQEGEQNVLITYKGFETSFSIFVYCVAKQENVSTNAVVTEAVKDVLKEGFVALDVELENYVTGTAINVCAPAPEGANAVYHVADGTLTRIENAQFANGYVSFVTDHFSIYVVGTIAEGDGEWKLISSTGGTTTYTYTRADSIDTKKQYAIVANSNAVALDYTVTNNGYYSSVSMTAPEVTISSDGKTMTTTTDLPHWKFSGTTSGTVKDADANYYLSYSSNGWSTGFSIGSTESTLKFTANNSSFRIWYDGSSDYSFYYNGSNWTHNSRTQYVRLYELTNTATTGGSSTYAKMEGANEVTIGTADYASQALLEAALKNEIKVYTASDDKGTGKAEVTNKNAISFEGTVDTTKEGSGTLTVIYGGKELGTISVTVTYKEVKSIQVTPTTITVERDTSGTTAVGTVLVTYADNSTEEKILFVNMLAGADLSKNGTYPATVTVGGKTADVTVKVVNKSGLNDYPSYPNPGSVELTKHATPLDQNTGLTRVELTASGLPASIGVDVVVVIDTSSSMKKDANGNDKTNYLTTGARYQIMTEALRDMLTVFSTANATTGTKPDIDVAIVDFNGFSDKAGSANTNNHIPHSNVVDDSKSDRNSANNAKIYTGTDAGEYILNAGLGAKDFVNTADSSFSVDNIISLFKGGSSGTNYDFAFESAYKLLSAKKAANGAETREQYVVFMTDGAPFRYNGFMADSSNGREEMNQLLRGDFADAAALQNKFTWMTDDVAAMYNKVGDAHLHRMAEAIKGTPGETYKVVDSTATTPYLKSYEGLGATMYSIGFCLADDVTSGTSSTSPERVDKETSQKLVRGISSGSGYYWDDVTDADMLKNAFNKIASDIAYAATNAVFMDQMGDSFNLQMNPTVPTSSKDADGNPITTKADTSITVRVSNVYTKSQIGKVVNGHTVTADDVGKPYGTDNVIETVTFTSDTAATSSARTDVANIISDGKINAKYFTYDLTTETFTWNIGTINEKQYTLSYMLYLDGSMEGQRAAGSYSTNNYATLNYVNWVGNDVSQSVPSPSVAWEAAEVSYGFYLVDSNGNPLDKDGNEAANFLTAYKVTQPVLYQSILLNSAEGSGEITFDKIDIGVLPEGYTMYDEKASYQVIVNSGEGGGSWTIEKGTDKVESTYVTGYLGTNDYSHALTSNSNTDTNYNYADTTVWFAVVWNIGVVNDTVVIDYGLPVDISVLENDMLGKHGALAGIGATSAKPANNAADKLVESFGNAVAGTYGDATVNGSKVRYTPRNMSMPGYDRFSYAASYTVTDKSTVQYYYGDVTVIPATTVYYEDSFLTLTGYEGSTWEAIGDDSDVTQGEDRPGKYSLPAIDANNIYGYDSAYTECSTYSLGSAQKVHLVNDQYATAEFTFYGTGFDVISLTSSETGTLVVQVSAGDTFNENALVRDSLVSTYYGLDANGNPSLNSPAALYQVPVMKIQDLPYGQYTARITATYVGFFDKTENPGYDLYLDAIRIYDPANDGENDNDDTTIQDAYKADGEGWPDYVELRNNIIAAQNYTATKNADGTITVSGENLTGAIFIDCADGNTSIADYVSYGPNNELYLANNQAIAFNVATDDSVADVQLGMKVGNGSTVTFKINGTTKTLNTATDMYYSILDFVKAGTVTIENVSDGILSLTNIKVTHKAAPAAAASFLWMDSVSASNALMSLRAPVAEEPEVPETTVPETSEPEVVEPETTAPEVTEEPTEPEATEPEETKPESSKDKLTQALNKAAEQAAKVAQNMKNAAQKAAQEAAKAISKLFSRWF